MRLGATSFVYRDSWLGNVQRLGPHVDDVEILFFAADGRPDAAELAGLAACKRQFDLTYTLHTPLDASLASAQPGRRAAGIDLVLQAIACAAPLAPEATVLHVYLGDHEHDTPPGDLHAWRQRAAASLATIVERSGLAPQQLCVESLDYDFALIAPVVRQLGLSVALDVGHLVRDGRDLDAALDAYLPITRLVQWHGTEPGGRDHRSLRFFPEAAGQRLLTRLRQVDFTGVLTLEVFNEMDFNESLQWLKTRVAPC